MCGGRGRGGGGGGGVTHQLADRSEVVAVRSHVTELSEEEVSLTDPVVHQGGARRTLT